MVLVSHKHRFISTKTAKSASTAVEDFFAEFCMPSEDMPFDNSGNALVSANGIIGSRQFPAHDRPVYWHHMPAKDLQEALPAETWDTYLKFCVVRNPFEKVISAFYFFYANKEGKDLEDFNALRHQEMFCDWLLGDKPSLAFDRPQYTINKSLCMDIYLKQESLSEDLQSLCERLELPCNLDKLSRPKSGHRPKQATCSALYSEAAKEFVEKKFAFELKNFGYIFPG